MNLATKIASDITIYSKYARYIEKEKRRENWDEIVDRCKSMHIKKFPKLKKEIEEAFEYVRDKKIFPSMRSLQFGGNPIELSNTRIYNCAASGIDNVNFFSELMLLLLGGTGVGFSVEKKYISKLSTIKKPKKSRKYMIQDSIIGWADSIKMLMKAYLCGTSFPRFDYREIRPKGSPIKTAGGKAPGAGPLRTCHAKIMGLMESKPIGSNLSPVELTDICTYIADAVLSGGIRRSAMICLFDFDDENMLSYKSGNWWDKKPERARVNVSAVAIRSKTTKKQFDNFWERVKASGSGEPGIFWFNNENTVVNPCVSANTQIIYKRVDSDDDSPIFSVPISLAAEAGMPINIWNGKKWSSVIPKVTGIYQRMKTIILEDTRSLTCTLYHKFILANGQIKQAKELAVGDMICEYRDFNNNLIPASKIEKIIWEGLSEKVYCFNEPDLHQGIFNGILTKQCGEVSLKSKQMCNLVSINFASIDNQEEFNKRCYYAGLIATLQASYTDFHYLSEEWKENCENEALIGVSLTGIVDGGHYKKWNLKEAVAYVIEGNKETAKKIGIKSAARTTLGKPDGCRPWYGLVTTNQGIKTLQELFMEHKGIWAEYSGNDKILGNNQNISKTFYNGKKNVYEIELNGQLTLQSTLKHPWFVKSHYNRKKRKYESINKFVSTNELVEGDILDINLKIYNKKQPYQFKKINLFSYFMRDSEHQIKQPKNMNPEIAWLLGYLWGDGCLSEMKYKIRFIDQYKRHLQKANNILNKYFGVKGNIIKCKNKKAYTLELASVQLWNWFAKNGIRKYFKNELDLIPQCVRYSTREDIIAFIAGFVDADGCVHKDKRKLQKSLLISQKPSLFTRHFQDIALSVGLAFNHSYNTKGKNFQKRKKIVLMSLLSFSLKESTSLLEKHCLKAKKIPIEFINEENSKAKNKFILGKVKNIKKIGKMDTYDIEVPCFNWYFAGAVKSHNTVSLVCGSSSGIHARHSLYYIRRMRFNKMEPIAIYLQKKLPKLCEEDVTNHNQIILSLPQKSPDRSIYRTEDELDILERVKYFHENWILPGHISGEDTHNMSVTVSIRDWEKVGEWMWENKDSYNGISVLPYDGGTYKQAPFEECTKEKYEEMMSYLKDIDIFKIKEGDDNTTARHEIACAGGACQL